MKRALAHPLAAYLAALCFGLPAVAETLRLGTSPDYRPFAYFGAKNQLQGFDIALGDALCAELKAECIWVQSAFPNLLTNLADGKIDIILAALAITPERRKQIDFTEAYIQGAPQGIFVGVDAKLPDITRLTIGVATGTVHEQHLRKLGLNSRGFISSEAAFQGLLNGEVTVLFGSPGELETRAFRSGSTAHVLGYATIESGAMAMAVQKSDDSLRHRLNQALARLRRNGVLARLRKTWLAPTSDI